MPFAAPSSWYCPHKDADSLTILAQDDVGGLEVRQLSDGKWIPVKSIPDAYIINIGDCFQVLLMKFENSFQIEVIYYLS
jgi:isopenicillin N synthase-like dioxygenase